MSSVSPCLPKVATFFSDDLGFPRTKVLSESRSLEKRKIRWPRVPSPGWREDRIKAQVTQPGFCRNQMPEAHMVRRPGMEKSECGKENRSRGKRALTEA